MIDKRPQADRILVAQLTGEARHRAKWRELTGEEEDAAVAGLQALAGGRADLLAEVAGIFEGTSEGEPDEPLARSAARLCRMAGADPDAIAGWVDEGRRRRAAARRPPFSGGLHGRGLRRLLLRTRSARRRGSGWECPKSRRECAGLARRQPAPAARPSGESRCALSFIIEAR
jgi:hypothetical protein